MQDSLYHDKLLSHYHSPHNYGLMDDFDVETKGNNPLCGDSVTIRLKFDGDRIGGISFEGEGCVISRAAASLISEDVKNKLRAEIHAMTHEHVIALLGVAPTPARMKCALLAIETIQKVL